MPSLRSKDDGEEVHSVRGHPKKNVSQAIQRKTYIQRASPQSNVVMIDGRSKRHHRIDTTIVPSLRNPLGIGIELIVDNNDDLKGKQVAVTKTSKPRGKKLNRGGVTLGRRKVCKKSSSSHIEMQQLKKEFLPSDLRQKLNFLTEQQFEKLHSFKVENLLQMLDLTLKQIISIGIERQQMEMLIAMLKREDSELGKRSPAQNSEEIISHVKLDEDTDEENPLVIDESFTNANELVENSACSGINLEVCYTSQSKVQHVDVEQGKPRAIDDIEKHLSMMRKSKIPTFLATAAEIKSELTYIVADLNATEERLLLKINESTTTATTTTTVVSSNVHNLNITPMFVKSNQEPIISTTASVKHELPKLSTDQPKFIFTQPTSVLMDNKQRSAVDADSTTSSPELMNGKTFAKREDTDSAHKSGKKMSEKKNESIEDRKPETKDDSIDLSNSSTEKKIKLTRRPIHIEEGNLGHKKPKEIPSKQPKYADDAAPFHSTTLPQTPQASKLERPLSLSTKKHIQNWDVSGATTTTAHKTPSLSSSPDLLSIDSSQSPPQYHMERDLRYKLGKYKKDNFLQEHNEKKITKKPNYKDADMLSSEDNVLKVTSAAIRKLAYNQEDSKDSYCKENTQQADDCSEDWDIDEKFNDTTPTKTVDKFYDGEVEGPQSPIEEKTEELHHFDIQPNSKVRRHINFESKPSNRNNNIDSDVIASPIFSPISGKNLKKINLNDYTPAVEIDGQMSFPAMTYFLYEFNIPKCEINKPEPLDEILHSLPNDPRLAKYRNKMISHTNIPQIDSPVSHHFAGVGDPRRRTNILPTSPYAMNNRQLELPKQHQHHYQQQQQQQTPNMLLYGCLQRSPWYQSLMSTMKIQINQSISVLVCAINNFQKIRLEDPNAVFDIFKLYCAGELLEILENLGLFVDVNAVIIEQRSASSFAGRSFASSAPINPTYSFIQQVMPTEYTKTSRTSITASTAPKFISCYISSPPMPETSFHHTQRHHTGLKAPYMPLGSPVEQSALVQSHTSFDTEEESWDLDEVITSPTPNVDNGCDHQRRNAQFGQRHERFGNRYEHRNAIRERNSFGYRKRF